MPFVSDIVGPQRPVHAWPRLLTGAVRRTSTIDTHPGVGPDSHVDLRARDVVVRESGVVDVLGEVRVRAHLADRIIDEISCRPAHHGLERLVGQRVGPGFRSTLAKMLPEDVGSASLVQLLMDDWVGAALVSGYAVQHAAILAGAEQELPEGTADRMAGICAGFAPDASLIEYTRRLGTIPSVHGPVAPPLDLDGVHEIEPLRAHGMRRFRRLDLRPGEADTAEFDAHFRDSHVDGQGVETIVHEYTVAGIVDIATRTVSTIRADVRVLPWQECPAAIGSAQRVRGMTVSEIRDRVRSEFVGTSTCTHLNDTLRALGDLDPLLSRLDDV